ncbi:MAG: hypothetical protein LBH43_18050 [Treponema sp.]|jgi:hypothetical protein|nr:hypothetical protein [Treponema sp.]
MNEELTKKLKSLREDITMLKGMFSGIDRYKEVVDTALKTINGILFELTGNEFYRDKDTKKQEELL